MRRDRQRDGPGLHHQPTHSQQYHDIHHEKRNLAHAGAPREDEEHELGKRDGHSVNQHKLEGRETGRQTAAAFSADANNAPRKARRFSLPVAANAALRRQGRTPWLLRKRGSRRTHRRSATTAEGFIRVAVKGATAESADCEAEGQTNAETRLPPAVSTPTSSTNELGSRRFSLPWIKQSPHGRFAEQRSRSLRRRTWRQTFRDSSKPEARDTSPARHKKTFYTKLQTTMQDKTEQRRIGGCTHSWRGSRHNAKPHEEKVQQRRALVLRETSQRLALRVGQLSPRRKRRRKAARGGGRWLRCHPIKDFLSHGQVRPLQRNANANSQPGLGLLLEVLLRVSAGRERSAIGFHEGEGRL